MIKPLSFITLAYSTWIIMTAPHQWIYGLPMAVCSLCAILSNETSRVWRFISGVALLSTSTFALFLVSTLQTIASAPSIKLIETGYLLPLGITLILLVSLRIPSSSNFLQSVLIYLIAGTALLSVLYSVTQYYVPMATA